MKYQSFFLFFLLSISLCAALNDPVGADNTVYRLLDALKNENLLGEKSEIYHQGIQLTRREVSSFLAVALTSLEGLDQSKLSSFPTKMLEDFERATLDFSEELELLFSFDIESLTRKVTSLEKAVVESRRGTVVSSPQKQVSAEKVFLDTPASVQKDEVPEIPELMMEYDKNDSELNQKVTLNLSKTELPTVLSALFEGTSFSLVTGADVKGKVNVQVEDKPLIDVLKSISEANKFDFQIKGKIVTLIPVNREVSEIIKLNFAEASEIMNMLESYRSRTGVVRVDKRTNSLLINDTVEAIRKMKNVIASIDVESEKTKKILHMFTLKFLNPRDLESILTTLKSPEGIIQSNAENNTMIVVDYITNINTMKDYVAKLDLPVETKQIRTEIYNVRYAKAQELVTLLQSDVFKKHDEFSKIQITSDERTNSLLLSGRTNDLLSLRKYIKKLDSRNRQVVITAKIIEANLDDSHSEGINWTKLVPRGNAAKAADVENNLQALLFDEGSNARTFSFNFGTLDNEQFRAVLQALKTFSNIKVISNPTITTLNNQEAKILIGEKIPFEETTTTSTGTSSKVTFKDVGITLTVTPSISSDNYITMKLHPEISEQKGVVQSTGEPIIGSTEADTSVLIRNGDTLVIGGLVKESTTYVLNKVPLLGDIPGIGRAFQYTQNKKNRIETVIFITPTIVDYEEGNPYEISEYFE